MTKSLEQVLVVEEVNDLYFSSHRWYRRDQRVAFNEGTLERINNTVKFLKKKKTFKRRFLFQNKLFKLFTYLYSYNENGIIYKR